MQKENAWHSLADGFPKYDGFFHVRIMIREADQEQFHISKIAQYSAKEQIFHITEYPETLMGYIDAWAPAV